MAQPSSSQVHSDKPIGAINVPTASNDTASNKKSGVKLSPVYLSKFKQLLETRASELDPAEFQDLLKSVVRTARAHAGGTAKAANQTARKLAGTPSPDTAGNGLEIHIKQRQMSESLLSSIDLEAKVEARFTEGNEDDAHLWIGFSLDPTIAEALVVPGGEAPEDMHITLCIYPGVGTFADVDSAKLVVQISDMCRQEVPLHGKVSGVGIFDGEESKVLVALMDVPGLDLFRARLVSRLADRGISFKHNHGYVPHITLKYLDDGEIPVLPDVSGVPGLTLDEVTVASDDEAVDIVLAGTPPRQEQAFPVGMYSEEDTFADDSDLFTLCASEQDVIEGEVIGGHRLFMELGEPFLAAEPPDWVPYIPVPGIYRHPKWGKITLTSQKIGELVHNFEEEVYQKQLPIDAEHMTKQSGALAWISAMRHNSDGSVDAKVDWTNRGVTMVEGDAFKYISPEWYEDWEDPATGRKYKNVATGGALTTRPFFKEKSLKPLVASEGTLRVYFSEDEFDTLDRQGQQDVEETLAPTVEELEAREQALAERERQFSEQETETNSLRSMVESQQEDLRQAGEVINGLVVEQRRKRFTDIVMGRGDKGDGVVWFGEPETNVSILETMADTIGEDDERFDQFMQSQRATAEQLKQASALTVSIGTDATHSGGSGLPNSSGGDALDAAARKLVTAGEARNYSEAMQQVIRTNPSAYSEHSESIRDGRKQ